MSSLSESVSDSRPLIIQIRKRLQEYDTQIKLLYSKVAINVVAIH